MHKFFYTFFILLLIPVLSLAHENHPPGAPDHPIDSPEYHETVNISNEATEVEEINLLKQLLLQLQALLVMLLGMEANTADVMLEERTPAEVTAKTQEITTTGNLVMTTDANYRYFSSNGLPEYSITGNRYANSASAQDHEYRVPLYPEMNDEPTYYNIPFNFGIALNGVTFEPFAAEWYERDRNSGWQEDPFVTLPDLDENNAHVQPSGLYHYHGQPTSLIDGEEGTHSSVIGFAGDGFPLYGPYVYADADDSTSGIMEIDSNYELKSGTRPSGPGGAYDGTYNEDYEHVAGDADALDECNGRYGVTPEFPEGTYYYVATESFPYIPRCLMGEQDASFAADQPAGGRR